MSLLDERIAELSERYLPLARQILSEAIRIPADYVDRSEEAGGDPSCGLSNHEGPRLEYMKSCIIEYDAVRSADDVGFDEYGNLVWSVQDPNDGIPENEKRVIYMDGHTDTVKALRSQWTEKIGGGIDAYDGLVDPEKVDRDFLRRELGHLPPEDEWGNLIFGHGAADQVVITVTSVDRGINGPGGIHDVIAGAGIDHLLERRVLQIEVDVVVTAAGVQLQSIEIIQRDGPALDGDRIRGGGHRVGGVVAVDHDHVKTAVSVERGRVVESAVVDIRTCTVLGVRSGSGRGRRDTECLVTRGAHDGQRGSGCRRKTDHTQFAGQSRFGDRHVIRATGTGQ